MAEEPTSPREQFREYLERKTAIGVTRIPAAFLLQHLAVMLKTTQEREAQGQIPGLGLIGPELTGLTYPANIAFFDVRDARPILPVITDGIVLDEDEIPMLGVMEFAGVLVNINQSDQLAGLRIYTSATNYVDYTPFDIYQTIFLSPSKSQIVFDNDTSEMGEHVHDSLAVREIARVLRENNFVKAAELSGGVRDDGFITVLDIVFVEDLSRDGKLRQLYEIDKELEKITTGFTYNIVAELAAAAPGRQRTVLAGGARPQEPLLGR